MSSDSLFFKQQWSFEPFAFQTGLRSVGIGGCGMSIGSSAVWRYKQQRERFPVCDGLFLEDGVVLLRIGKEVVTVTKAFYTPYCYDNGPVLSTFRDFGVETLPLYTDNWMRFVDTDAGSFKYSVYPIIYSLTVATVIAIFLTLIVFTNYTSNPSWILRGGSVIASANLLILIVRSIVFLGAQHSMGYNSGEKLLNELQSDNVFNIIDFIVVLIATFAQVQVIIRLFSRVREKRVSFILGGTLSVCSQVIWGVSTFSQFDEEDESDISILPAFVYLLRIALSTMYSGLIIIYAVSKRKYIFHKSIILLTLLTAIVINIQVSFFIVDIADIWVSELSEVFNTTIYVSATVVPWEWINRVHVLERNEQREGVLGRPVYEDEYRDITRYEIMDDTLHKQADDSPDKPNNETYDGEQRSTVVPRGHSSTAQRKNINNENKLTRKVKETLKNTTEAMLYLTDHIIEYSLAVPRSISANSNNRQPKEGTSGNVLGNRRKEVFVYSKKEVNLEEDDVNSSCSTSFSSNTNASASASLNIISHETGGCSDETRSTPND